MPGNSNEVTEVQAPTPVSFIESESANLPEPVRSLKPAGFNMWVRLWSMSNPWISPTVDLDHVTLLCESIDERVALRQRVLADGDWRELGRDS